MACSSRFPMAVVCVVTFAPLACTAPPSSAGFRAPSIAGAGGSGIAGAGGSSVAGAGGSGVAGAGGTGVAGAGGSGIAGAGGSGVAGAGGTGVAGAGGPAGSSGGSGPTTAVPAGPRRTDPGDAEWPQLAYSPVNTSTTTARIPENPQPLFDTVVDGEIAYTTPVVGDGKLFYQLYPGGMVALDAGTGAVVWQNRDIGGGKYGTGAYEAGRVFTVAYPPNLSYQQVVALDATTGAVLWTAPPGTWGALKVDRGTVYFTAGQVIALDAATGERRWASADSCGAPPAIDGDRVYCVGTDNLLALDAATGALIYAAPTAASSAVSAPAVADGRLYYVGARLYARAIADGAALWDADFGAADLPQNGGTWIETSPAVAYGKVFVVGSSGVFAFDAGTGAPLWQTPAASSGQFPGTSVAIADGRLVVSGNSLLDADDGRVLWTAPGDRRATSTPVVTDGHFYGGEIYRNHVYGWSGSVPGVPPVY